MSGVRAPVVAGVAGGVGTSTLAAALRAHDAGRTHLEIADILACRGTVASLRRVAAVLERPGTAPPGQLPGLPPVLAVTLDGARLPRGPVRTGLELLDGAVSAVVLLPHVARWRTIADPVAEVVQLLVEPAERLPRPLRAYVAALRELAAAVAASGRLQGGPHPARRPGGPGGPGGSGAGRPATSGLRGPVSAPAGLPPVVGAFRPVVGTVSRAAVPAPAPPVAPPGAAEGVRRPRGVRIVPAGSRSRTERIEQVG